MEICQEIARGTSIRVYRAGLKREGERLDFRFEQLFQTDSAPES